MYYFSVHFIPNVLSSCFNTTAASVIRHLEVASRQAQHQWVTGVRTGAELVDDDTNASDIKFANAIQ